jgi:hypothetical protein
MGSRIARSVKSEISQLEAERRLAVVIEALLSSFFVDGDDIFG